MPDLDGPEVKRSRSPQFGHLHLQGFKADLECDSSEQEDLLMSDHYWLTKPQAISAGHDGPQDFVPHLADHVKKLNGLL